MRRTGSSQHRLIEDCPPFPFYGILCRRLSFGACVREMSTAYSLRRAPRLPVRWVPSLRFLLVGTFALVACVPVGGGTPAECTTPLPHGDRAREDSFQVEVLTGVIDDTRTVFLTARGRVLRVMREVDYVESRVVHSDLRDVDYLIVITEQGPPGTCIWYKAATIYFVFVDGDWTGLTPQRTVSLGGYLACADGRPSNCGCGTWEASWQVSRRGRRLVLSTTPRTTPLSSVFAPSPPSAPPPPGETVAVD